MGALPMRMTLTIMSAASLLLVCTACFGIDFGYGGGLSYSPFASRLSVNDPGLEGVGTDHFNFGAVSVYVDFPYIQANFCLASRFSGTYEGYGSLGGYGTYTNRETYLGFSVLLKYTFLVGSSWVYPLLGVENDINLAYTDSDGNDLKSGLSEVARDHLNRAFLKTGVGFGFPIGKALCLSSIAMVGMKLNSVADKATVDYYKITYGLYDVLIRSFVFEISLMVGTRPSSIKLSGL
jgi:hypothetical protein